VFVCLSVCLSILLLADLRKNYLTDLPKNFTTVTYLDKEELIKFWKSSASGSHLSMTTVCDLIVLEPFNHWFQFETLMMMTVNDKGSWDYEILLRHW